MKLNTGFLCVALFGSTFANAEYKESWTVQNFYEAVNLCRSSIIYPAAQDYEAAGLKKGQTRFALKNDTIANVPLFEMMASDVCYCALNQYAKDYAFSERKIKNMDFAEYLGTPDCKSKIKKKMDEARNNPKAFTLP